MPEDHIPPTNSEATAETRTQTKRRMWSDYMSECYHSRRPPAIGTVDVNKVEQAAREKLKDRQGASRFPLPLPRFAPRCLPHAYTRGTSHG